MTKPSITFERQIPAFLQRMQSAQAGQYDRADPQLAKNRRHGKPRSASEEAEDAPVVLDGDGNVVEGANIDMHGEVLGLQDGKSMEDDSPEKYHTPGAKDNTRSGRKQNENDGEKVASIGANRKRKLGRVVGGEYEDDETKLEDDETKLEDDALAKAIRVQGGNAGLGKGDGGRKEKLVAESGKSARVKTKKKVKKIKLSFDNEG